CSWAELASRALLSSSKGRSRAAAVALATARARTAQNERDDRSRSTRACRGAGPRHAAGTGRALPALESGQALGGAVGRQAAAARERAQGSVAIDPEGAARAAGGVDHIKEAGVAFRRRRQIIGRGRRGSGSVEQRHYAAVAHYVARDAGAQIVRDVGEPADDGFERDRGGRRCAIIDVRADRCEVAGIADGE